MKSDYEIRKALIIVYIKEHWKDLLISLSVLSFFILFILSLSFAKREVKNIEGKVIGLTASQDYDGHTRYLVVATKGNKQALARISKSTLYRKGCKVLIQETTRDLLFVDKQYRFLKYLDKNCLKNFEFQP